jgi:hypothetical protein
LYLFSNWDINKETLTTIPTSKQNPKTRKEKKNLENLQEEPLVYLKQRNKQMDKNTKHCMKLAVRFFKLH